MLFKSILLFDTNFEILNLGYQETYNAFNKTKLHNLNIYVLDKRVVFDILSSWTFIL